VCEGPQKRNRQRTQGQITIGKQRLKTSTFLELKEMYIKILRVARDWGWKPVLFRKWGNRLSQTLLMLM
jgi:hypothetical protein